MRQQLTNLNDSYSFLIQSEPLKTKFETVVTETIDDILSAFGNKNKQAIYRHLENNYDVKKEAIPLKIEDFTRALEQTFGSVGKLIEIKNNRKLTRKMQTSPMFQKKES